VANTSRSLNLHWGVDEAAKLDDLLARGCTLSQVCREFPHRSREHLRRKMKDVAAGDVAAELATSSRSRANPDHLVRAVQAHLVAMLRQRGYQRWDEPLWPNGPSPADLEREVWPTWAAEVRLLIAQLDEEEG
jgi:hypothetical protein